MRTLAAALDRGAAVVLYEPDVRRSGEPPQPSLAVPSLKARLGELARAFYAAAEPTIVGVTGTNGKTTVAYLLAQVLSRPRAPCAYVGTLGLRRAAGDHGARH